MRVAHAIKVHLAGMLFMFLENASIAMLQPMQVDLAQRVRQKDMLLTRVLKNVFTVMPLQMLAVLVLKAHLKVMCSVVE